MSINRKKRALPHAFFVYLTVPRMFTAPVYKKSHLLVRYTGQCFAVEDKNSTNGTCINGNRLEPGELVKIKNGDKVKMGNEVFTVEIR